MINIKEKLKDIDISKLTDDEQAELLDLLEQRELERVTPKMEQLRDPIIGGTCPSWAKVRGARGGRGSLAKSHSMVSLIVQRANVEAIDVACFREIQGSIDESVKKLIEEKVEFLGYKDWIFKNSSIEGPLINGKRSHFIFKGLKDLRAATSIKSLEAFDIYFIEEAATVSMESLNLLLPTLLRHDGAQLWFCYNPNLEDDPITVKIWDAHREDAILIEGRPGREDNEWFNDAMVAEMERDKKIDYDEYLHTWEGQPYTQGDKAIFSRAQISQAMERTLPEADPGTPLVVGCDVARFGDDRTVIVTRRGMKADNKLKIYTKLRVDEVADKCEDAGLHDPTTIFNIDEGNMGAGVVDILRRRGYKHVHGINFGGSPSNKDKYTSTADELWFDFKDLIDIVDIPNNNDLKSELCSRQYDYDNRGRRKIESKQKYKDRRGRSPDLADALLLCYYNSMRKSIMSDELKEQMRNRRRG